MNDDEACDATGDAPDRPDPEPGRVLHVDIESFESALRDAGEAFAGAYRGDSTEPRHRLTFHSPEQFQEVFNATNLALLRTVRRDGPESIRALARLLDRNVSPVHADLETLADYGLVEFRQGEGRAKRPVVPYDEIRINVALSRDDGDDRAPAPG